MLPQPSPLASHPLGTRSARARGLALCLAIAALVGSFAKGADIPLDRCIETALKANPGVHAAEQRVAAARAAWREARSTFYPRLSLAGSFTRTDNPPQAFMMALNQRTLDMRDPAFDPNAPDDTENLRLSVEAAYALFDGGRRAAAADMAGFSREAAAARAQAARNALVHEVARAYYSALQTQAFRDVQREAVRVIEESLRVARERLAAGSVVRSDVLSLEVKLAEANEDLIRLDNGARLAILALNTAVGRPLAPESGITAPPRADPGPAEAAPADSGPGDHSVADRPELAAVESLSRVREAAVRGARREWAPTVSLFGSYDWDGDRLYEREGSYLAGVRAEWEAFGGGRRPAVVARARAELEAARHDALQLRNELEFDLRAALLTADEARRRIVVAAKSVKSAEEAFRITSERYSQGAADIAELLMAQAAATAARTRDAAAYYDCLIARSNVARARGGYARGTEP